MGLDTVELVMELEDNFNVSIPNADAERMRTSNEVTDWLMARLRSAEKTSPACTSARTFYQLRRGLMTTFGTERRQVKPSARLGELVMPGARRGWPKFAREHGLPRPPFKLFGERFVDPGVTVADLVARALLYKDYFSADGQPARDLVLLAVRRITSEQTGLSLEEIGPDSNFINELGMG